MKIISLSLLGTSKSLSFKCDGMLLFKSGEFLCRCDLVIVALILLGSCGSSFPLWEFYLELNFVVKGNFLTSQVDHHDGRVTHQNQEVIDLFYRQILFTQYRSRDNTQESNFFESWTFFVLAHMNTTKAQTSLVSSHCVYCENKIDKPKRSNGSSQIQPSV